MSMENNIIEKNKKNSISLFFISLILIILIFEISLRLFYPLTLENTIFNEYLRYEKIPYWEGYIRNPQFLHTEYLIKTKFNSKGLNDYEFFDKDKYTILALGDSFTYGYGVDMKNSYPNVIEKNLGIQVINAGTGSYALDTYLNYIKYYADEYSPEIILIALNLGDINEQTLFSIENDSLIENKIQPPKGFMKIRRFMLRHSHAYSFILRGIDSTFFGDYLRKKGVFYKREMLYNTYDMKTYRINLNKSEIIIKEIKKEVDKRKIELIFVLIPTKEDVYDDIYIKMYNYTNKIERFVFQKDMVIIFDKYNISYIQPLDIFRNNKTMFYWEIDGHFNEIGYKFLGDIISDYLQENNY